jgi:hypothetical protein
MAVALRSAKHINQSDDGSKRLIKVDLFVGPGERHLAYEAIVFGRS